MECGHEFTMCRLCLCKNECFVDIFQENEWFGNAAAEVIRDLLQFQVFEKDGYPHVVCSVCLGKLTDFKQFKVQCLKSRDTYDNVFRSDESHAEHPADIVPSSSKNTAPEEGRNNANPTTEIRKCSIALTRLDYLSHLRKRTCCESNGQCDKRSNSVNHGGKLLSKRKKNVAVDAITCENIESSGSVKVKLEKMDIELGSDCISPADINMAESGVLELRRETLERLEEGSCVDTNVDSTLEAEETFTLKLESDSASEGEREREEEAPLGVIDREGEKERFRCNDCGKCFDGKDVLIRHLGDHGYLVNGESSSGERESQANANVNCESKCKKNEVRKKGLKGKLSDSVKKDQVVRKYVCDSCGKGFSYISQLKTHLIVHIGEKPVVCDICDKRFSDKCSLRVHKLTHTGEKRYKCKVCCKGFTQNGNLKTHMLIHSGEKPHECKVCNKCFGNRANLITHSRVHTQEKPFACQVCKKCFGNRANLITHSRVHTQEKPFACQVCKKCFGNRANLITHSRVHSQEKPYACQVCKKCFSNRSTLRYHLRIHTQEKPYECQVCKRCFSRSTTLKMHLRIHTQERPYECRVCKKDFRSSSNLSSHITIHSQEKPHACQICKKCFRFRSKLGRHLRIHLQEKTYSEKVCKKSLVT